MKFGKELQKAVQELPVEWRAHTVDYRNLKKSLKQVQLSLEEQLAGLPLDVEVVYTLAAEDIEHHIDSFLAISNKSIERPGSADPSIDERVPNPNTHWETPVATQSHEGQNSLLGTGFDSHEGLQRRLSTHSVSVPVVWKKPRRSTFGAGNSSRRNNDQLNESPESRASEGVLISTRRRSFSGMKTSTDMTPINADIAVSKDDGGLPPSDLVLPTEHA
ncbi:hypothetical protein HDU93_005941, partial [Gonapodya sp. JEL0774]